MNSLITLFADFNNTDTQGRIRLNTTGLQNDLRTQNISLKSGMKVLLDDNDELKAFGIVEYSTTENIWVAVIKWEDFK